LNNALEKDHSFKGKLVAIDTTDKLPRKQVLLKSINYFSDDAFKLYKKDLQKKQKAMS